MKNIINKVVSWIRFWLMLVGLIVVCGAIGAFYSTRPKMPELNSPFDTKHPKILQINLSGAIQEKAPKRSMISTILGDVMGEPGPYLPEFQEFIEKVAGDGRIKAILIRLEDLSGGISMWTELRNTIQEFKTSGKKVYIWAPSFTLMRLYLASVADTIYAPPSVDVNLRGPRAEITHIKSALESLGIQFTVVRAGGYKNLYEFLSEDEPSKETQKEYAELFNSLENSIIPAIKQHSGSLSEPTIRSWLANGLYTASEAKDQGIIDEFAYLPDLEKMFEEKEASEIIDEEDYELLTRSSFKQATDLTVSSSSKGVALLEATGNMVMASHGQTDVISVDDFTEQVQWAKDDDDIVAVVLRISSGGGVALAGDLMWKELVELAKKKPLVVSMGSVAASGGYYIAAPAQKIFAEATTITGSIGVIGAVPHAPKMKEKLGVSFHTLPKDDGFSGYQIGSLPTETDLARMQGYVDGTYHLFLERVAEGRKKTVQAVHEVAQGRVWTGEQAVKLGLVDEIGGLKEALASAKGLAQIRPEKKVPIFRWEPEYRSILQCLKSTHDLSKCVSVSVNILTGQGRGALVGKVLTKLQKLEMVLEHGSEPMAISMESVFLD